MSFAHPLALLLLLLLIPVGLLYWLRLRVPRVVIGTGVFWQQALAEEPFRARWQRWRTPVSLLLHVLTITMLALAAAGLEIPPPQRIVLILDNSATMRATDVQPSRLDAAKAAARRMIDDLRWCDRMAIVDTNSMYVFTSPEVVSLPETVQLLHDPEELQPLTSDRASLRAAVDSLTAQAEPPAIALAVTVGRKIGAVDDRLKPGRQTPQIVLVTDGSSTEAVREAERAGVEVLRVGTMASNCAITCFSARRSKVDPIVCEVFVEVRNNGDQAAQGALELFIDGKPRPSVPFTIEKDGRWQHLFDKLTLPKAAPLRVKITPADAYPFDDTAEMRVPPPKQREDLVAHPPIPDSADERQPGDSEGGLAALFRDILLADSHQALPNSPMLYAEFLGPLYGEPNGVDIRMHNDIGKDVSTIAFDSPKWPVWIPLAAAAAALVVLEWCLYLRRWTN